MITVEYVEMVNVLKGFTIFDGDFHIIINSALNANDKTAVYLREVENIEGGTYSKKLERYREMVI
jgi:hypothetical protein